MVGWLDGWMVGCWMDGWMVGESGIKANSAQFSWSLAELGKNNSPLTSLPVDARTVINQNAKLVPKLCWVVVTIVSHIQNFRPQRSFVIKNKLFCITSN